MMRKAIIDLGTNTFNLLIGEIQEGRLKVLSSTKEPVLLGMGGINEGIIAPDAWARAIKALSDFKEICKQNNIEHITGFGTSAIRGASNGKEFIEEVRSKLGIEIKTVSGNQEALLIYKGVRLVHDFTTPAMIMDIGGGSTEFVLADANGIIDSASFDIGVSRIYQLLHKPENYSSEHYRTMEIFIRERTGDFFLRNECHTLIGASGSFETFYEMIFKKKFENKGVTEVIPMEELQKELDWVLHSSLEERIEHEWIVPMRKHMLPIAAFKIKWVLENLKCSEVVLSPYSLKEGAFFDSDVPKN